MATLAIGEKKVTVDLHQVLIDAGEDLGIPFSCESGVCETCKVKVIGGQELLTEPTEEEQEMDLEKDERLCCQMQIALEGVVQLED